MDNQDFSVIGEQHANCAYDVSHRVLNNAWDAEAASLTSRTLRMNRLQPQVWFHGQVTCYVPDPIALAQEPLTVCASSDGAAHARKRTAQSTARRWVMHVCQAMNRQVKTIRGDQTTVQTAQHVGLVTGMGTARRGA